MRVQGYLPANDPDRPAIEERIAASIYKQAEAKQTAGDATGAVDDFLRVALLAPNSKVRANAEFDAAGILIVEQAVGARSAGARKLPAQVSESRAGARSDALAGGRLPRNGPRDAGRGEFERIAARTEETGGGSSRSAVAGGGAVRESRLADQRGAHCTRAT